MAGSIAAALSRIKQDPLGVVGRGVVERVCRECGHEWRQRELDPATTVALFVQQVVHGNCPCQEVRHLGGCRFTASAYCQARSRMPLSACQALLTEVIDAALPATRETSHRWLGRHRVFHVDGSTFSMPDTKELRKAFGVPAGQKKGCGFPTAHLLVLFNASTGLLLDAFASPLRTGDLAQMPEAHLHLDEGDVLVGDDAFGTYAHIALLLRAKLHGLFPVHHSRIVDFTPRRRHCREGKGAVAGVPRSRWVKALGRDDQLVEWLKPSQPPLWMTREQYATLPDSITVRELRRTATRPGAAPVTLTMVTTLTDRRDYKAKDLLALRLRRWDVETNIAHLKTAMKMDVLRCKSERGVRKELAVFCLVYNLVRLVMLEAARRQEVAVARISFADALRWVRHARAGRRDARPARQPAPPQPRRAPLQEAPPQALRPDDQAPRPAPPRPQKPKEKGLT